MVSAAVCWRLSPDPSGTYRAVYTVSIGDSIYVIHTFQKKSRAGIATPRLGLDLVRQRLRQLKSEGKDATNKSSGTRAQLGQRVR